MSETSQDKKNKDDSPALKAKKRDRSASENRLIQAGLEVFSKYGFNGATTKMIAKKADVNESLIGRYFDGKEGLLIAIVEMFLEELQNRELPYAPKTNLTEELIAYSLDRIDQGCFHEEFARIIFTQALVDRKFKKRALETITMQLDPRLIARVAALEKAKKLIKNTDIEQLCEELDTYLSGLFFFAHILHENPIEEIKKRATRFVTRFAEYYQN